MPPMVKKAKSEFLTTLDKFQADPYKLRSHVPEVDKWALFILKKHPEANEEILRISVWLHDIGHYPIPTKTDHAIRSEKRAKAFLEKENYPKEKQNQVLHCVRSHRCRDILPETLEAKMLACIDSASHMTDTIYMNMAKDDKNNHEKFRAYAKMERDYRDLKAFPEIQKMLEPLYKAWKNLIKEYDNLNYL